MTQCFDAGWLNEDGERGIAIFLLHIHPAFYVNVENHILALGLYPSDLTLQCAIVSAGIHLFIFHQFIVLDGFLKLLGGEEIIVHAIDLTTARFARGSRNRELQSQIGILYDFTDYGRFSATRWRGYYDQFSGCHLS